MKHTRLKLLLAALIFPIAVFAANPDFSGKWVIDKERSTAFDPWSTIELEIEVKGKRVWIDELVSTGRRKNLQSYELDTKASVNEVPIALWTGNRHIGAYIGGDRVMRIVAQWVDEDRTLQLDCNYTLRTSQGETPARSHKEFRISTDGDQLIMMEMRSSRPRPILYVFNREQ